MKRTLFASLLISCSVFAQQLFPPNHVLNTRVDTLPVLGGSDTYIANIGGALGSAAHLRLDDVMPLNFVPASQSEIVIGGLTDSDSGGYAIPNNVKIEPGDQHALVIRADGMLYEVYALSGGPGNWAGATAAKWDLHSYALRPDGMTSSDAAGLPIAPLVLRYAEVASGAVQHALRFTAPNTPYQVYWWPARHYASHNTAPMLPPFGLRVRLKASFNVSPFPPFVQVILRGLQQYGMILADNGMSWGSQHDDDPGWAALGNGPDGNPYMAYWLHQIPGSAMEVVDESPLSVNYDLGLAAAPGASVEMLDRLARATPVDLGVFKSLLGMTTAGAPNPPPPPPPAVPAPATPPIGYLDTITPTVYGWTLRPDNPALAVTVQIYVDGLLAGSTQTALPRPDVHQYYPQYPAAGLFGFVFAIPQQFRDGKLHQVYAYALDAGNSPVALSTSPRTGVLP